MSITPFLYFRDSVCHIGHIDFSDVGASGQ